jgi:hypothetical protein
LAWSVVCAILAVVVGCRSPVWDPEELQQRLPGVHVDLRPLAEATPYLLPARGTLTLFLCRWRTGLPIPVSLPSGLARPEKRAVQAALRAWERAGLGIRFVPVEAEEASLEIELVDGPVPTASGPGGGNTIADCRLEGPGLPSAGREPLAAELEFASIRLARRTPPDARGRDRVLSREELAGAALHELGHALGFQGHVTRGPSAMRAEVEALRRLGADVLEGAPFVDVALRALYAIPSGVVLEQVTLESWRTSLVDRMGRVAAQHQLLGPFARVGDASARVFWRDPKGREFGLQVINLRETLRKPERPVVVPEARVRRVLPRSRDRLP